MQLKHKLSFLFRLIAFLHSKFYEFEIVGIAEKKIEI
jgi:hypothetical protein